MNDSLNGLMNAISTVAIELPRPILEKVARQLMKESVRMTGVELAVLGVTPRAQELLHKLGESWRQNPEVPAPAIATALLASSDTAARVSSEQSLEIVWTGPSALGSPIRRVDQALYELIDEAERDVLLASYVTYKAEKALKALHGATKRGVEVRLVLELAEESGGKLNFDGLSQIKSKVPSAKVFYWPLENRRRDARGRHGIFHAKCLVADGNITLVSSANLTDYGLEENIELGFLMRSTEVAKRLKRHFEQLVFQGELRELS
ncbi:MAG: DISARM system phospholipase D-like protein DrmC [Nitrospirota bacterium]|nr:DISARM system phospholipase D-like protein DrmC [Nitrospirota bacterium]